MKTFDLNSIIETYNLNVQEVAAHLFPTNKYPKLALDRILKFEAFLDTNQMSRLSLMTGASINDLYADKNWDVKSKKDILTFTHAGYKAELNTKNWVTKVYADGSIFHESVIHGGGVVLSEYLKKLNQIIKDHE